MSEWYTAAAAAKSLQSCPTLCNPIDDSPPGSPVPGILQARILEWGAIAFSVFNIILPLIGHTHKFVYSFILSFIQTFCKPAVSQLLYIVDDYKDEQDIFSPWSWGDSSLI